MNEPKPLPQKDPDDGGRTTEGGQHPAESEPNQAAAAKPLTPEEQMALYEQDLKEKDWGHQPC